MPTRWGQGYGRGISYRPFHSTLRPWTVKFLRHGKWTIIGSYPTLRAAQRASEAYSRANPPYAKKPPPATIEGLTHGPV